jgi:hypothetical protein
MTKTTLPISVLFALTLGASAFAQDAALLVNCGNCNMFQGIEVVLDGESINTGVQATARVVGISPGEHEVKVFKWNSPFSRDELATAMLKFPAGTELRVKANPGELTVYGKGKYEAPPPVATGPSAEQQRVARDLIGEAADYVAEAAEANEDDDSRCQGKVGAKLELISDNLKELRAELDLALMRKTLTKAEETQALIGKECPTRVSKSLGKKMNKVVARLEKASSELR